MFYGENRIQRTPQESETGQSAHGISDVCRNDCIVLIAQGIRLKLAAAASIVSCPGFALNHRPSPAKGNCDDSWNEGFAKDFS